MYTSALLLSLLPVAFAQYGGSDSGSTSSTASAAASIPSAPTGVQQVKVSNNAGNLTFTPDNLTAAAGTTIEFIFYPKSHSVAQAAFAAPCEPLNGTAGFFSGPYPVSSGTGADVFTITVNDTKPIWFYCATGNHCQSGMVGVINAPADKTIDAFKTAAAAASKNVAPAVVQGGTKVAASDVKSPTGTGSAAASTSSGAGVPSSGGIQWALLGLTGAAAAGVGGLIL